jgi:hypothetical protein
MSNKKRFLSRGLKRKEGNGGTAKIDGNWVFRRPQLGQFGSYFLFLHTPPLSSISQIGQWTDGADWGKRGEEVKGMEPLGPSKGRKKGERTAK